MTATFGFTNAGAARGARADGLFRRRLMSRSDVKRAQRVGHSQNRQLMRGGRA